MGFRTEGRIAFLDGLRGLAIALVVLFHAYARWHEIVPFKDRFSATPPFAQGWIGVELFFLISGFVIFMTLERCTGFGEFMLRRWLRLFPAMLACSAIVFATAPLFPERPGGMPAVRDLLPGLTFIAPVYWQGLIGGSQGVLEGAFWSLFVEFTFYFLAGGLYFAFGAQRTITGLLGLFALSVAIQILQCSGLAERPALNVIDNLSMIIGAPYFGWFAAGALFHGYVREQRRVLFVTAAAVTLASGAAMTWPLALGHKVAALLVVALFAAPLVSARARAVLSHRAFLWLGFVSYPLYLVHENMLVAMIVKLGRWAPWLPPITIPVVPVAAVLGLGWLVAAYVEPSIRNMIEPLGQSRRTRGARSFSISAPCSAPEPAAPMPRSSTPGGGRAPETI